MIDQLVALSSMAVVNIRDSVTEASLSIAKSLLQSCIYRKNELVTVNRQILAEEGGVQGRSKSTAVQNPKYQACLKQRDTVHKVGFNDYIVLYTHTVYSTIIFVYYIQYIFYILLLSVYIFCGCCIIISYFTN